jgi:hypothetical protein
MTYNFDPDRWYDIERSALEATSKIEKWSAEDYEKGMEDLEQRLEDMIRRLEGTYQLPGKGEFTA